MLWGIYTSAKEFLQKCRKKKNESKKDEKEVEFNSADVNLKSRKVGERSEQDTYITPKKDAAEENKAEELSGSDMRFILSEGKQLNFNEELKLEAKKDTPDLLRRDVEMQKAELGESKKIAS